MKYLAPILKYLVPIILFFALSACGEPPEAPAATSPATQEVKDAAAITDPGADTATDNDTSLVTDLVTGPDYTLEAMSPDPNKPVDMTQGITGDVAEYLVAIGASSARISPDGKKIAFKYSLSGLPELYIMDTAGGEAVSLTPARAVTFFRWMPDSQALLFGADSDGDEREAYFRVSITEPRTTIKVLAATENGYREFGDISRDGGLITYASTERNGLDFDIYTTNLTSGATKRLYEGIFGYYAHDLSPDKAHIITTESVGEDSDNLYLLDVATGVLTTISKPSPRGSHRAAGFIWRHDSSGFYYASNTGREFMALYVYDLQSQSQKLVAQSPYDIDQFTFCGPNQDILLYSENVDGFDRLNILNLNNGQKIEAPKFPEGQLALSCSNSGILSVNANGWKTSGNILTWDFNTAPKTVFQGRVEGLDVESFVKPVSFRTKAHDGVEIQGLLYSPPNTDSHLPPVLFDVHGGPTAQSVARFDGVAQYYVSKGFAVFLPNVRGSTGFGRTYTTLDDKRNRRDSVRDLIDLLEALGREGKVDTARAAVTGGSYGGYMVNAVLALYPESFKAGVCLFGVADWVSALQVASPALKASDRIEYGDIREQEWVDFYTQNSPIRLADRIKVPVLYSHGVQDPRIDIYETEIMVKTLRANGIDAPYIRIEDEGHGWRKLSNLEFYYKKETEFLERVLSPE